MDQEVFRFPFVISRSTYGLAAATVLAASIVSAMIVRRKLDDLDLIAVLKSKERESDWPFSVGGYADISRERHKFGLAADANCRSATR